LSVRLVQAYHAQCSRTLLVLHTKEYTSLLTYLAYRRESFNTRLWAHTMNWICWYNRMKDCPKWALCSYILPVRVVNTMLGRYGLFANKWSICEFLATDGLNIQTEIRTRTRRATGKAL